MPLQNSSILELRLQYGVGDEECTNLFYYGSAGSGVPCSAAALEQKFLTSVLPSLAAILSNQCQLRGIDTRPILQTQGPPARELLGGALGTVSADALPSPVTATYTGLQDEISQRTKRRWYFSGLAETWFENGAWDYSGHTAAFNALGNALRAVLAPGAGETNAIPALRHNTQPPGVPPVYVFYAIVGWGFSTRATHQRRRTMYQTRSVDVLTPPEPGEYDDSEGFTEVGSPGEGP